MKNCVIRPGVNAVGPALKKWPAKTGRWRYQSILWFLINLFVGTGRPCSPLFLFLTYSPTSNWKERGLMIVDKSTNIRNIYWILEITLPNNYVRSTLCRWILLGEVPEVQRSKEHLFIFDFSHFKKKKFARTNFREFREFLISCIFRGNKFSRISRICTFENISREQIFANFANDGQNREN